MGIIKEKWGTLKTGEEVYLYSLKNKNGMEARLTNLGAGVVNLFVPDKNGKVDDVVLGYDNLEDYLSNPSFFSVTIGPNANRVGGAAFTLNGKEYHLPVNDGPNNLHSDMNDGYHKRAWTVEEGENSLTFAVEGKDGEMGFPGNKKVKVTFTLTDDNELKLTYYATSDMETLINLTNHTYFNLAGHDSGSIEDHLLCIHASNYTPVLPGAIPTGEIAPVAGTPLDFTKMKRIGEEIGADWEQLKLVQGYDHNFALDGADGTLHEVAEAEDPKSGRRMKVFTTLPGMQFYAGNCIAEQTGKGGVHYGPRMGFCLEAHYFPDNIHHPEFKQAVFGADKAYASETIYKFE